MLTMRVEFHPSSLNMDDESVLVCAADDLATLANHFSEMTVTFVLVASVFGHEMYATKGNTREIVLASWREKANSLRATAYVCEHCLVSSLKDLWGPGRITCPACGKMADAADGSPRP